MRWILTDDVETELPEDWSDKVEGAREHVAKKAAAARKKVEDAGETAEKAAAAEHAAIHEAVKACSKVWAKAGAALRMASDGKCWYCETRPARSDLPVDHFRPKGSVKEDPSHPGYWWLAFDWENLRLSCTFCNSLRRDVETGHTGGKQDNFPIIEPPARQRADGDASDRPALLDPTSETDPALLVFQKNGFAAASSSDKSTEDYLRAKTSIDLYHLNHRAITRKRAQLSSEIRKHVAQAEEARALANHTIYKFNKAEIIKRVRSKAELATAARTYLRPYKNKAWVQELLDRDL